MRKPLAFFCVLVLSTIACSINLSPVEKAVVENFPKPLAAPVPLHQATVTAVRSVNIRSGASEHFNDIGDLWHGEVVEVTGCFGLWAKIRKVHGSEVVEGFVRAKYLGDICK